MIVESIVTTCGSDGTVNIAPMGPVVTHPQALRTEAPVDPGFVLRPFAGSRTFDNLMETRRATIHLTDDAALFAKAAVTRLNERAVPVRWSQDHRYAILNDCHRWFSIEVTQIEQTPPRYEMQTRLVDSSIEKPFFGFNRAKHAVLEAAILATRTHLIPADDVIAQLAQLRPLVEKTAGQEERDAFEMLCVEIDDRLNRQVSVGDT